MESSRILEGQRGEAVRRANECVRRRVTRVFIVGGPGSGKTELARRVGVALGVEPVELDAVAHTTGTSKTRDLASRLGDASRISEGNTWVAEGIYIAWTDAIANAADLVIWLDLPWRICAYRIVKRHFLQSIAGDNPYPGGVGLLDFSGQHTVTSLTMSNRGGPQTTASQ